jgi:D-amino peptidase
MPHIVTLAHLNLKGALYQEARKITTKVTLIAVEELKKSGFDEVIIADSHGPMVNLLVDEFPDYVEIVRGYPRPLSMVAGAEGCDSALFIGYHAKFGTVRSTFDHTFSGASINRIEVNGITASEFLLNAYAVGEFKIPIILVAGEAQLLKDDVKLYAPWAEMVPLKHSMSRSSARSPSMKKIEDTLRKAVGNASTNHKKGKTKLLLAKKPVRMKITFLASHLADTAELLPAAKRIDGLTVEYTSRTMIQAYRTLELLIFAASGTSAILESQR